MGFRALLRAGLAGLDRHRRLAAFLYLAELACATIVTLAVGWSFVIVFGSRPLFDRAVAGDLDALVLAFDTRISLLLGLAGAGGALALAWAVASFYLSAGLYGALAGRSFGESAGAGFGAFARLWLWSVLPFVLAGLPLAIGLGIVTGRESILGWGELAGTSFVCLLPGVLALGLVSCLVDYARALLATGRRGEAAGRALVTAARLVFTRTAPLAHFFTYVGAWLAITAIYALLTWGRDYAGVGGAVLLFVVRQLTLATRFAARVAVSAGQVAYVTEHPRLSAP